MPKQSLLNLIKRWKRYEPRQSWQHIPPYTRGLYVLYTCVGKEHRVFYIGVAGIGATGGGGIRSRIKRHDLKFSKGKWSHYSYFEVHDNVGRAEIRELESLLLTIFRFDARIKLANKHKGSRPFTQLRRAIRWKTP